MHFRVVAMFDVDTKKLLNHAKILYFKTQSEALLQSLIGFYNTIETIDI